MIIIDGTKSQWLIDLNTKCQAAQTSLKARMSTWIQKLHEEIHCGHQCIIRDILYKNDNFASYFKQNYKRKIKSLCSNTPDKIMTMMVKQYNTDITNLSCQCGEASLLSAMLVIQLPWSHLIWMEASFQEIDAPGLDMRNSTNGDLIVEYNYMKSEKKWTKWRLFCKKQEICI